MEWKIKDGCFFAARGQNKTMRRQGYLSIKGTGDTFLGAWSIAVKATIKRSGTHTILLDIGQVELSLDILDIHGYLRLLSTHGHGQWWIRLILRLRLKLENGPNSQSIPFRMRK